MPTKNSPTASKVVPTGLRMNGSEMEAITVARAGVPVAGEPRLEEVPKCCRS
jgi:hypothetical protein